MKAFPRHEVPTAIRTFATGSSNQNSGNLRMETTGGRSTVDYFDHFSGGLCAYAQSVCVQCEHRSGYHQYIECLRRHRRPQRDLFPDTSGANTYTTATQSASVTVTAIGPATPSRRRRWASMSILLWVIVLAGAIGCGGGGQGSTPPNNPTTPATTAGSYTFTLTGTDTTNAMITTSANVIVNVQ